jgi:hypothetical protein
MIKLTETQEITRLKSGCIRIKNVRVRRCRPGGFFLAAYRAIDLGCHSYSKRESERGNRHCEVVQSSERIWIYPAANAPGKLFPIEGADHFSILSKLRRPDGALVDIVRRLVE